MKITISNPMTSVDLDPYLGLASSQDIVNIHLSGNPRWRFLAESSLLSLLMQASAARSKVFVHLDSVGSNGALPETVRRQMTETVPGMLLGRLTSDLLNVHSLSVKDQIQHSQLAALKVEEGIISSGHEASAIAIVGLGNPYEAKMFSTSDSDSIQSRVRDMVTKRVGDGSPHFAELTYVWHFLYELISNTSDHAVKRLDGSECGGVRFFTVRRINTGRPPNWYFGSGNAFVEYFDSFAVKPELFVEFTVADCGIGVAAKLEGSMDIYREDIEVETRALLRAFRSGESSKSSSDKNRGHGFSNVLDDLKRLRGMLAVRTGRLLKTYLYSMESFERATALSSPLAVGTTVSILVPWKQLRTQRAFWGLP